MKGLILLTILAVSSVYAQQPIKVRISKAATTQTLSLHFAGVKGDTELDKFVLSDLINCGWFKLTTANSAKYKISGVVQNGTLTLSMSQGSYLDFSLKSPVLKNKSWTSHKLVDAILKKMYNIDGICSSHIAFSAQTGKSKKEIYLCDFDGKNVQKVTNSNTLSVEPDWMPSNDSIVYTMYSNSKMYIVEKNIKTNRSRRLTSFSGLNSNPSISPNGKYIAMILSKDGVVDLYIREVNGRAIRRLTQNKATESSPCWSPDGTKICFVSDRKGKPRLFIINVNGSGLKQLPTKGYEAVAPDWSVDNKIVYCSRSNQGYNIAYMDLTGVRAGGIITNSSGDWESPSWAPDGRHVICARTINGKSSLYKIDSWTKKTKKIIESSSSLSLPTWSGIK